MPAARRKTPKKSAATKKSATARKATTSKKVAPKAAAESRSDLPVKAAPPERSLEARLLEPLEERILYELTPDQEERLARESDHPAFHRTAVVPASRFLHLGPEVLVKAIPRASTYRLDVACVLLTDLFGRSPVRPGERIVVYFKETYSGPATGGGRQIVVGDAKPDDRKVRVDNGLFYHELTHCVDDTRPVHDYKRGLTEGIANVGALFVADMFAGTKGRFEALSRGGREALRRHHLDRENAYWLIPAYAPSEGMLTEILARHAPAPDGHVDWPKLGDFFRLYRKMDPKTRRTHRLMAHMGLCSKSSGSQWIGRRRRRSSRFGPAARARCARSPRAGTSAACSPSPIAWTRTSRPDGPATVPSGSSRGPGAGRGRRRRLLAGAWV